MPFSLVKCFAKERIQITLGAQCLSKMIEYNEDLDVFIILRPASLALFPPYSLGGSVL